MSDDTERKAAPQRTVNLARGLNEVADDETLGEIRSQNKKKSVLNLSVGLSRAYSEEEVGVKKGNPMLKIGLEMNNDQEESKSGGDDLLLSMNDMMSLLDNSSLGEEAWETKKEKKEDNVIADCRDIMAQLGLTDEDTAGNEIWETKASTEQQQLDDKTRDDVLPPETVFNMLGLSDSDLGEAWESKTSI